MRRSSDPDVIARYAADESNTFFADGVEAIVFPQSEADVAEILREANASGTPAEPGRPWVATPEPAAASRPSECPW